MKGYTSRRYAGIPVGVLIRRDIAKTWIYRVRRGHGFYGTKLGETIQDRYTYFVPNSINNPEGQISRYRFAAAVAAWQALSNEDKLWWNIEAKRLHLNMSGYNLFIREEVKKEVHMFVDRGDPAASDFALPILITDATWRDLDLSGIIDVGAIAVVLHVFILDDAIGNVVVFRKNGNVQTFNIGALATQVANIAKYGNITVACDSDRKIEYYATNTAWSTFSITVKGWWI